MFEGYKAAKKSRQWEYDQLLSTPCLHSSQYLHELYTAAENKEQEDCILDHMNRHAAWEVDSYRKIEKKIISERWK
jgi:hypothetical protein